VNFLLFLLRLNSVLFEPLTRWDRIMAKWSLTEAVSILVIYTNFFTYYLFIVQIILQIDTMSSSLPVIVSSLFFILCLILSVPNVTGNQWLLEQSFISKPIYSLRNELRKSASLCQSLLHDMLLNTFNTSWGHSSMSWRCFFRISGNFRSLFLFISMSIYRKGYKNIATFTCPWDRSLNPFLLQLFL